MNRHKVVVRIAGKEYTLVGAESDEYIQKLGLFIDRKMVEIMKADNRLSTSLAAVLTSVNVADEYFKAHESEQHHKKELKRINEEIEKLREDNKALTTENDILKNRNTNLQLDLAKREAELNEVRKSSIRDVKPRIV